MRRSLLILTVLAAVSVNGALPASATTTTTATRLLGSLTVAPEGARAGYDRDLFEHWIDSDGDSCDTRYEVLISQSTTPVRVEAGCYLSGGTWKSIYDNVTTTRPSSFDVDHVVALAEAWDSGASRWDAATRRAFANDLDSPWSLIAVTASSNRAKSDHDATRWQPATKAGRCWLANATIITKWRWSLTIDTAEKAALTLVLNSCPTTKLTLPPQASPVTTASPTTPQVPSPTPTPIRSTVPAATPAPTKSATASPTPTKTVTVTPAPATSVSASPSPTKTVTASPSPSAAPTTSAPTAVTPGVNPIAGGGCPSSHPVKGNVTSTDRIYHTPASPYYSRTSAEVCFADAASAAAAGFRAPK